MEERLFDGKALRATLLNGGFDKCFVTFCYRKPNRNGFEPVTLSEKLEKEGWAQLRIQTRVNDWFINDETEALETALSPVNGAYDRLAMLGFSMGGYGAFRFAKTLGADTVVAVSPQCSIHPDVVPWDSRYRAESKGFRIKSGNLGTRGDPALKGLILVDPFRRLDMRHARLLCRTFPGVAPVLLPFGGHPASDVLRDGGKTWVLQRAARQNPPDPEPLQRLHRQARGQSVFYWSMFAQTAAKRHPGWANAALDRAGTLEAEKDQDSA